MSAHSVIRWLHLSDFHVGKDAHGQHRLFKELLAHTQRRVDKGEGPDMVFITGDIAQAGKAEQYETFVDEFLEPLSGIISSEAAKRLFLVPGNHDSRTGMMSSG